MSVHLDVLRRVELLQDLDDASLTEIAASGEEIGVPRDTVLAARGEEGTHFFIVLTGRVRIVIPGERDDQPPILLKTHEPGGFFGEMSLLTGDPISADVIASEDTRVLRLTREVFEATFTRNPSVLLRLNRVLSRNLSNTNVMVSKQRLARFSVLHRIGQGLDTTFISLYLAASVAQQTSKRIILVDCESTFHGPLARFGLRAGRDGLEVFDARRSFINVGDLRPHCVPVGDRFDVLTFSKPLSQVPTIEWTRIHDLLTVIRRLYDVVLVDTGHTLHPRASKMLRQGDKVYLLAADEPGHQAVAGLVKELDFNPSQAVRRLRIGLVGDFDFTQMRPVLEPLVEATGIKSVFLLDRHEVNNFHMSPDLMPVIDGDSPTGRRLASLAREIAGCRVGLALGSGGAKGFAHIGIMRVLERLRVPVDAIVGCSMGSIIGACFALGKDSHEVERMARELWACKGAFFDWQIPPWTNIVKGRKVDRMADNGYRGATVLDCAVPYAALAFDLITGQEVVIDEGTIKNAVRASGSMPAIMRPVQWKSHYLIDGGVTNKVPVDVLANMGTDFNIAVNVAPEVDPSFYCPQNPRSPGILGKVMSLFSRNLREMYREPNMLQIISRWYSTSSIKLTEAHLHLAHVTMRPDTEGIGMLDFLKLDEAIAAGVACAEAHAGEITAKLTALRGK